MQKITEVTYRDLKDIILYGFKYYPPVNRKDTSELRVPVASITKIQYHGKFTEPDFLARLYALGKLPSFDKRYSNAYGDIFQHRVNNYDWDESWLFSDSRLNLAYGNDDKFLLEFICEMFHPAVRDESDPWKDCLEKINQLLNIDGYEIYESEHISGRSVYKYRAISHIHLEAKSEKIIANLKILGSGSYANVYKFKDEFYQKEFALKRAKKDLTPKELERFQREFQEMRKLYSPYILEVFSYDDKLNEYIMELMDITLYDYIQKNNANIDSSIRKGIIAQLLKAFEYLHSKEVLHRDVSPKNILLKFYDNTFVIKVSDFGLVKILESELTSENSEIKGCLNDPELRVIGFSNYTLLHESYALCLLIAYILTGKMNFGNIRDQKIKVFLEKGTNADKTLRFQNIEEIRKNLPY